MTENTTDTLQKTRLCTLPRNVWAVSLTSFFMDISSEMVVNILPLFLSNMLGVKMNVIGLIEGVAEATASLLKAFSGWLSDRLQSRKWLAVAGVRWADRVGKGQGCSILCTEQINGQDLQDEQDKSK